jgi:hypothetical protein
MTKSEIKDRFVQVTNENTVLLQALNLLARNQFKTTGRKSGYTVKLADPCAPHGGIVLVTFAPNGQQAFTQAHYLEKWHHSIMETVPGNCPESNALRVIAGETMQYARSQQMQQAV